MSNSDKIILDLCGGTGSWSKPYRDAGYDVILVTLPDNDVRTYLPPQNVYGILAAPPCTEFSLAKRDAVRDFRKGMECVIACLNVIWQCRYTNKLQFWALENPKGFLRQFLGKPAFTFEQWQFGDEWIKPTDLWGYFNIPKGTVKNRPDNLMHRYPGGKLNSKKWSTSAKNRAITPPGFAEAFFKANR